MHCKDIGQLADIVDTLQAFCAACMLMLQSHANSHPRPNRWEQLGVRDGIGWAKGLEEPGSGRFQIFDRGYMVWISQTNKTYVFAFDQNDKIVRVFDIPFSEK